jgi:hypothetical protein
VNWLRHLSPGQLQSLRVQAWIWFFASFAEVSVSDRQRAIA